MIGGTARPSPGALGCRGRKGKWEGGGGEESRLHVRTQAGSLQCLWRKAGQASGGSSEKRSL